MPKISIIIRSKNEEKWIGHCLKMVMSQSEQDFEIILVDNRSEDATVAVARRNGVKRIISIDQYLPGAALNTGIRESSGDFLVFLSAHCIPVSKDWLKNMVGGFKQSEIVGVYGRQIPLSFISENDKRDLLITFGLDRRVQVKDYFFHNANSMILRNAWEEQPFDEQVTNIEDRIWAKKIIEKGKCLLYEPEAVVYHYHGIHHDLEEIRLISTVSVLESMNEQVNNLPLSMLPANIPVVAICPVVHHFSAEKMDNLVENIKKSKYVDEIFVVSELKEVDHYCKIHNLGFIKRPKSLMPPKATVEDVLKFALQEVENHGYFSEVVLYVNYLFKQNKANLFDDLIIDIQYKGCDSVFPAFKDYNNYWRKEEDNSFRMIGNWLSHEVREPMYRAINGLGTVTRSNFIRKGQFIGDNIALLVIDDYTEK